jgi:hypothetical protein
VVSKAVRCLCIGAAEARLQQVPRRTHEINVGRCRAIDEVRSMAKPVTGFAVCRLFAGSAACGCWARRAQKLVLTVDHASAPLSPRSRRRWLDKADRESAAADEAKRRRAPPEGHGGKGKGGDE